MSLPHYDESEYRTRLGFLADNEERVVKDFWAWANPAANGWPRTRKQLYDLVAEWGRHVFPEPLRPSEHGLLAAAARERVPQGERIAVERIQNPEAPAAPRQGTFTQVLEGQEPTLPYKDAEEGRPSWAKPQVEAPEDLPDE